MTSSACASKPVLVGLVGFVGLFPAKRVQCFANPGPAQSRRQTPAWWVWWVLVCLFRTTGAPEFPEPGGLGVSP